MKLITKTIEVKEVVEVVKVTEVEITLTLTRDELNQLVRDLMGPVSATGDELYWKLSAIQTEIQ